MEDQKLSIPTELLPVDYRNTVGEKFNIKPDTVGRIAAGTRKNTEVFDFLLELAEEGKKQELDRLERLKKLHPPLAI